MLAGFSFVPIYFQSIQGDTALMSGVKLFPLILSFLAGAMISSVILQKSGRIWIILPVAATLLTTGIGLLDLLEVDTSYGTMAGYQIIFGLGIGSIFAITSVTLQNSVSSAQMGVAMSAFTFFQLLGGALGIAVEGSLLNHYALQNMAAVMAGQMDPTTALLRALNKVFLTTIAPGAVVFLCSWWVVDPPKSTTHHHHTAPIVA